MRIAALDLWLDDQRVTYIQFSSTRSIFEYDIVFWDPANTISTYEGPYGSSIFQGLVSFNDDQTARLLGDLTRRNKEFHDFLNMGRTLVILASGPQEVYVGTGKQETSGTGRNQKVTRLVDKLDILSALPAEYQGSPAVGTSINACHESFGDLLRSTRDWWQYRAVFEKFDGTPLAKVEGTNKVVGSIQTFKSGGTFLLLPDWLTRNDEEDDVENGGEEVSVDDKKLTLEGEKSFHSAVIDWVAQLSAADDDTPTWARDLLFVEDRPRVDKVNETTAKIEELEKEIAAIEQERAKDNIWKDLVTASGKRLEKAVESAFKLLGFSVFEAVPGRRDLRISFDDSFAVVEIKGVKKSASEANAAQLEKWVNEEYLQHGVTHKGILVVNTWRHLPVAERKDKDFPDQMIPFCTARGHSLVTGLQLLSVVRRVLRTGDNKGLAESLLANVGRYVEEVRLGKIFDSRPTLSVVEEENKE